MSIELIQGDCMDYLRDLPDNAFELAIVDPPYGIGFDGHDQITSNKGKGRTFKKIKLYAKKDWDFSIPSNFYFEQLRRSSVNQIIWGGNYFTNYLTQTKSWIFWDKVPNTNNLTFSDGELAWTSTKTPTRMVSIPWIGFGMLNGGERKQHPTQKPVKLYEWLLTNYAKPGDRILDTHLGSGSSAIACHNLGFNFVGMELDKDYYEAACKRLENHQKQPRMFDMPLEQKTAEQGALL